MLNVVSADDIGKAIHPVLAEGQVEGGTLQGVGYATIEEIKLVDGRYLNDRLATYLIPTSLDAPRIESILVEQPFSGAPHGAKGVGELPMDVPAAAVVAAIHDATGAWVHDLPATPERIMAVLHGIEPPPLPGISTVIRGRVAASCERAGTPRKALTPVLMRQPTPSRCAGRTTDDRRMTYRLTVNGAEVALEVPGMRRLLDVLREDLGLTGTKEGCGEGECGACSVLVDGQVVDACLVPVCQVDGAQVMTVEGSLPRTSSARCSRHSSRPAAPNAASARRACSWPLGRISTGAVARTWTTSARASPATCAAARATPRSSMQSLSPRRNTADAGRAARHIADHLGRRARPCSVRETAGAPLAGGTDVMVQITGEIGVPPHSVLDLWHLDELRGISPRRGRAGAGRADDVHRHARLGAVPRAPAGAVRRRGDHRRGPDPEPGHDRRQRVNASPAGDMLPLLLATDAELVLASTAGERSVPAAEFWPAYRQTVRHEDELLVRIRIPLPAGRQVRFRKVGTRRAQAISKVVLALAWREDGGVWRDVRVALGSVAATPIRARETERVLEGAAPRETTADHAAQTLAGEIQPIDDVRSTADYRRVVAARVLHRLLRDAGGW